MGAPYKNMENRARRTKAVVEALEAAGVSLVEISKAAGVTLGTVERWLLGDRILVGHKYEALRTLGSAHGLRIPEHHVYLNGGRFTITSAPEVVPEAEVVAKPAGGAVEVLLELAVELSHDERMALAKRLVGTL